MQRPWLLATEGDDLVVGGERVADQRRWGISHVRLYVRNLEAVAPFSRQRPPSSRQKVCNATCLRFELFIQMLRLENGQNQPLSSFPRPQ